MDGNKQVLSMEPKLVPRLTMQATPDLCLFSSLLMLPSLALDEAVEAELASNPALVRRESVVCGSCGCSVVGVCPRCARSRRDLPVAPLGRDLPAARDPLEALLADAIDVVDAADRPILAYVLADLSDRGFLDRDFADVARDLGVNQARVERVVEQLRSVTPPGTAARDVQECLTRQLDAIERREGPRPVERLLVDHLEELATVGPAILAAQLAVAVECVEDGLAFLRQRLRPSAGLSRDAGLLPPPPPDLQILTIAPDSYLTKVVDDPSQLLAVDKRYRQLAQASRRLLPSASVAERDEARRWVWRADQFLRQLRRRSTTLEVVATAAVNHQRDFLREGPSLHRPLTRAELAGELGLHESTVSRAVRDKILRRPDGSSLPLVSLFGTSVSVVAALRELLAAPGQPRTDQVLAAELNRRGFAVARRTVTKYRHQLTAVPAGTGA